MSLPTKSLEDDKNIWFYWIIYSPPFSNNICKKNGTKILWYKRFIPITMVKQFFRFFSLSRRAFQIEIVFFPKSLQSALVGRGRKKKIPRCNLCSDRYWDAFHIKKGSHTHVWCDDAGHPWCGAVRNSAMTLAQWLWRSHSHDGARRTVRNGAARWRWRDDCEGHMVMTARDAQRRHTRCAVPRKEGPSSGVLRLGLFTGYRWKGGHSFISRS